jgi:hypothetical protein
MAAHPDQYSQHVHLLLRRTQQAGGGWRSG